MQGRPEGSRESDMPIANYSVLKGRPTAGKVVSGASRHYQITVAAGGSNFTVAVNIQSVDGSEVLYAIEQGFEAPDPSGLPELVEGLTALVSEPGGLALDFVRGQVAGRPMITRAQITLLPKDAVSAIEAHALENAVVQLLNEAIADGSATVYVFGSAFSDCGVVDGIHNIHMNQGNPPNNHGGDNGIWQDGALFLDMRGAMTAIFIAFQTESWKTDDAGNPEAARVHRHHALEG